MQVSILTGYRIDGLGVGVRVLVGASLFPLHVVHTGSGAHPAFYPKVPGDFFSRGKAIGA
jgi:hypothetical protein